MTFWHNASRRMIFQLKCEPTFWHLAQQWYSNWNVFNEPAFWWKWRQNSLMHIRRDSPGFFWNQSFIWILPLSTGFSYDRFLHFRYILQTRSGGKSESLKSLNIDILHLRVTLKIKTFKNRIFIFDLRMTSFISHSQVLFVAWNTSLWFARMHIALLFFPEMEKNLQFNLKLSSGLNYNGGVWPWLAPPNQSRVKGEWGGEWGVVVKLFCR